MKVMGLDGYLSWASAKPGTNTAALVACKRMRRFMSLSPLFGVLRCKTTPPSCHLAVDQKEARRGALQIPCTRDDLGKIGGGERSELVAHAQADFGLRREAVGLRRLVAARGVQMIGRKVELGRLVHVPEDR